MVAGVDAMTLGQLVRTYRRAAGLTLEDVAARTGVGSEMIARLERGQTKRPRTEAVMGICAVIGLPLQDALAAMQVHDDGDGAL